MALKLVVIQDENAWMDTLQGNASEMQSDDSWTPSDFGQILYEDRLDQVWHPTEASGGAHWVRFDPLQLSDAYGPSNPTEAYDVQGAGGLVTRFYMGQWDKTLNVQRCYGIDTSTAKQLFQVDKASPFIINSPDFAADNWRAAGIFERNSTGSNSAEGYRSPSPVGGMVIFEGAEPSDWPAGYALQAGVFIREGGVIYERLLVQIDLADGTGSDLIDGPGNGGDGRARVVPTPAWYTGTGAPVHPTGMAGPLGGHDVTFNGLQFTPDPDSTLPAPKGRLFMMGWAAERGALSHRTPSGATGLGTSFPKYVKIIEWNPTGKAATTGNVNRVHLRQILLSRMVFLENTSFAGGGIGIGVPALQGLDVYSFIFHPPTETFRVYTNMGFGAADGDTAQSSYSLVPLVESISTPTAQNRTETGKLVTWGATVEGDLGERIAGVDVDWTNDRRSTEGEILAVSGGVGGTATVQKGPIDGQSVTDNSLVVFDDLTPLTLGVHYTVTNLNPGLIQFISPHDDGASVYTVNYVHQATGAQPPHSILRNTQSRSDANGLAIARTDIPDDDSLEGTFDGIDAVEAP